MNGRQRYNREIADWIAGLIPGRKRGTRAQVRVALRTLTDKRRRDAMRQAIFYVVGDAMGSGQGANAMLRGDCELTNSTRAIVRMYDRTLGGTWR